MGVLRVKVSDKDGQRTEERLGLFADETLEVSDDEPVAVWRRELAVEEGARLEFGKVRCGG